MNMQTSTVMEPPAPKGLGQMQLPVVMMRDILLKTIFRKNLDLVSEISEAVCLPIPVTQELVDLARSARLPGRVINVGSALETSVAELARVVLDCSESDSVIQRVPFHEVFPTGFVDPPRRVPCLRRLQRAYVGGDSGGGHPDRE